MDALPLVAIIERLGTNANCAGLLGTALSLRWAEAGWRGALFSIGCGLAAFVFGAQLLAGWLGIRAPGGPEGISLFCGVFGRHFAMKIADAIRVVELAPILKGFAQNLLSQALTSLGGGQPKDGDK